MERSIFDSRLALYTHLAQGVGDIKHGRVHDADQVVADIIAELEKGCVETQSQTKLDKRAKQ